MSKWPTKKDRDEKLISLCSLIWLVGPTPSLHSLGSSFILFYWLCWLGATGSLYYELIRAYVTDSAPQKHPIVAMFFTHRFCHRYWHSCWVLRIPSLLNWNAALRKVNNNKGWQCTWTMRLSVTTHLEEGPLVLSMQLP